MIVEQYDTHHVRRAGLVAAASRATCSCLACKRRYDDRISIAVEIVKNALVYASEEMGIAVRNSAYSPNIKERLDHSCALFDRFGRLIAQAEHIPVHLGSLPWGLQPTFSTPSNASAAGSARARCGSSNDPDVSGTHLNDVTLVRPIYPSPAPWSGYAANKAHHADVGGSGARLDARRARPISLPKGSSFRRCAWFETIASSTEIVALFRANSRTPDARIGDLRAQVAGNYTGERRLLELCDRYGVDAFEARLRARARRQRETHARRLARARQRSLRDTTTSKTPVGAPSIAIALRLELRDGSARFDYSGHGGADSRIRSTPFFGVTLSGVHYALRAVTDPTIPMNEGCFRPVEVFVPEGTLLNPRRPAPVSGGNVETSTRNADVVLQALAQAAPERVPACSGGTMSNVMLGGARPDGRRGHSTKRTAAAWAPARTQTASTPSNAT